MFSKIFLKRLQGTPKQSKEVNTIDLVLVFGLSCFSQLLIEMNKGM